MFAGGRLSGLTASGLPLGLTVGGSLVAGTGVGSAHVRAGKDIGPIVSGVLLNDLDFFASGQYRDVVLLEVGRAADGAG